MSFSPGDSLDLPTLAARYAAGDWTPAQVLDGVLARVDAYGDPAVWICRLTREQVFQQVEAVEARRRRGEALPLYCVPFAVKDNMDVAGYPTTVACPAYAYVAGESATSVARLCAAGAIVVGKTNLDQFATGLVGTRSPYGACRNPFDPRYISGGSSSGSAVAVAAGLVSFALATDTAGSGRVPAAFNNIVGLKPSLGRISTAGLVPACRTLDCVSVLSLTCDDAAAVVRVAEGPDPLDCFSRDPATLPLSPRVPVDRLRFGVPADDALRFFGNAAAEAQFRRAVERLVGMGATPVPIDYEPFARAAVLLYDGPWVAERLAALREFVAECSDEILPVTRGIIQQGRRFDALAAFEGVYELQALRVRAAAEWRKMDVLLLPSTGTIYTIEQVDADPVRLNTNLGYYTNFVNLMDLSALAVPSGFQPDGLPTGVTFVGPAGAEPLLLDVGDRFHRAQGMPMGATGKPMPPAVPSAVASASKPAPADAVLLAVVGAHLSGQPLNGQLTERGARLVRTCRTGPDYKLVALPNTVPPKPGLVRVSSGGAAVEVEVWELSAAAFGSFVAAIPSPLGIGTVRLEDGQLVKGFVYESFATEGARDISHFGGWRAFLKSL